MPDENAFELIPRIKKLRPDLPIIVLTGFDDLSLGMTALRSGAEDYLVKSHLDTYTLARAIRYAIERRRLTLALIHLAARVGEEE